MKKIVIDGKEYSLDIDKAIKDGYLIPTVLRKCGQIYRHSRNCCSDVYYLVTNIDNHICLYSIFTNGRWTHPMPVSNVNKITDSEWDAIIGTSSLAQFTLMETPNIDKLKEFFK